MDEIVNYRELGLRCGLEIHYQLATEKKLFCNCPVGLRNDPHDAEIIRHMRPTLSELGEYDGTALMEFKTKKEVHYQLHYDTVCTYEMDDTPPFEVNKEALSIALEIALLLNCQVADEIHVSRKQYLDGSIPTGFQRSIAVGVNGWLPFRGKKIRIMQVCLEEDACREVSDRGHVIVFRTDRLSTPLVEVITWPDMCTPEEAVEGDRELGRILRATGKVMRGIGSVRQDVNVSIKTGTRIEIKGVPKTGLIKRLVHCEAVRQKALLSLKREMKTRGLSRETLSTSIIKCSDMSDGTRVRVIADAIKNGCVVGAVKICGFAGLLNHKVSPSRTFADELRGRVRVIACLDGPPVLFHSDESLREGPSQGEWESLKKALNANYNDAVAVVWGKKDDVNMALSEIAERIREAATGVPGETRQVLKGGETDFERILPGPDRMYPDTDSAPISINETQIEEIKKHLPHTPDYWREKYKELLHPALLNQIIDEGLAQILNQVYEKTYADINLIATTLVSTLKKLNRNGNSTESITKDQLIELFQTYKGGLFPREVIPDIFIEIAKGEESISRIVPKYILKITDDQIIQIIRQVGGAFDLSFADPERKIEFLTGRIKEKLKNHVSGKRIVSLVRRHIDR
ncbi:Glutamyl-tRNA(Gln) amidotransferase subunit B [subsurface metagenome]